MGIPFVKLRPEATIPRRGSAGAAGLDLSFCPEDGQAVDLGPGERRMFQTGLATALPFGTYGRIAPRSGLAAKYGVDVLAGVIDADYRGELNVILVRDRNTIKDLIIEPGMRIAQLVIEQCSMDQAVEIDDVSGLDWSDRGAGGFGSTGV